MAEIIYAEEEYLPRFHHTLDLVAREQVYIEMICAPPFEKTQELFKKQKTGNFPMYFAMDGDDVIGWADISIPENPRLSHRGFLGMGVLASYRGRGIGSQLLKACLDHGAGIGLEKVELSVYSVNFAAIKLYQKFGFAQMGYVKNYRKLNGQYFDCLEMEKYVQPK